MGKDEIMSTRIGEILDMIDCHAIANGAEPKESAAPMSLADALLM